MLLVLLPGYVLMLGLFSLRILEQLKYAYSIPYLPE